MQIEQPLANYNGSPQVEGGYVRISNELLEAILEFNFTSRQIKVIFMVIRMTYGYNKKQDSLSGWQIAKGTNLSQQGVSIALKELIAMNVLIKHETGRQSHGVFVNELSLNKYYSQWATINKIDTKQNNHQQNNHGQNDNSTINEMITRPSMKRCTHKDNTKDIKDICAAVLNYLNSKANKNYKPVKANTDFINARIKDGFTKEDLLKVIDSKCSQWLNDDKMNQYLRPATLFNATKFSQYAGELSSNKPVNKDLEGML